MVTPSELESVKSLAAEPATDGEICSMIDVFWMPILAPQRLTQSLKRYTRV